MKKIRFVLTAMLLMFSVSVFAQNIKVTGTVTDASTGEAVVGASVFLLNSSSTYAVTDFEGRYEITVPSDGTIQCSFLGYRTLEVKVEGRTNIDISLAPETELLEDVIVVAYGVQKREAKTGSVTSMSGELLSEAPVSSVDKMLAGKMAGVEVTAASGQPGASSQIRIRGTSSINAGNEPLWVVDGIPVMNGDYGYFTNTNNAMSAVNPNDIESITVLKDAAAASIYGSRAANGVILVTTKGGKSGKAKFTARAKLGASQLANDNNFGVMNGHQLLEYQRTAAINAGYDPDDPTGKYYRPYSLLTQDQTNWMKEFTRMGMLQEYEINASAGNDKGKFYTSASFQKNDGIVYGVDYQRIQARANADYKLTKTLEIGTRINFAYINQNDVAMQSLYYVNPMFAGLTILPWTPFYDEYGNYNTRISENSNTNPLYSATHDRQNEKQYRTQATLYLQWKPVKGLTFKTNNMFEGLFGEGERYWAPDPGYTDGTNQLSTTKYINLTTSNTITYSNNWSDHSFSAMVGQEALRSVGSQYYMYLPTVPDNMPYPGMCPADQDETGYGYAAETLLSFFGNIDYNYASRYFLQASVRYDGSSLFGSNTKWGLFWSVGGSWNIHNERWMNSTRKWLSTLKLRASYGVNGNNNITPYKAYGVYKSSAYNGYVGMRPSSPANDDLSWEKNYTWNAGLDLGFFDGRLNANLDVYKRTTKDMLLDKNVPQTSGFSSNFMNIGSLENRGVELQIDGDIIKTENWTWNLGFNIAWNNSKILDLGDNEELTYSGDSRLKHKVGYNFFTYYLKDYYGVNPSNGEALWRAADPADPDNEDKYVLTNDYNKARYIYAGSPEAAYTGGFNTSVAWKGLSLSAYFEFKGGNKVLIVENRYVNSDGNQMTMNQTVNALNYWKNPGDTGVMPKPVAGNSSNSYQFASTRWMQDGSYVRVKDITLSYNLPKKALDKIHLQGLKFYVSGLNVFTFHDVDWWDPERGVTGMGTGIYPQTKTVVGGIELSF